MNKLFSHLSSISPSLNNPIPSSGTNVSTSTSNALTISYKIDPSIYKEVNGATVMLDSRVFNEVLSSSSYGKCLNSFCKLFYLLYSDSRNNALTTAEATEIFFNITKGFQSKELYLRRLLYLAIKELMPLAKDTIIVISSLSQDIIGVGSGALLKNEPIIRAEALRALCQVVEAGMFASIDKLIRQCLFDSQYPSLLSSAYLSCMELWKKCGHSAQEREVIKKWLGNEVNLSGGGCSKYHGLLMAFLLRSNDRMSTLKLLGKYHSELNGLSLGVGGSALASALTTCLLLRTYTRLALSDSSDGGGAKALPEIQWKSLLLTSGHSTQFIAREIIGYEAILLLTKLFQHEPHLISNNELINAVSLCQSFLSSSKNVLKFAAIRVLNQLSNVRADLVSVCNLELESLVTESNKSIAMLAMTTLLKTGNDSSVDRLMSSIGMYLPELGDDLKINIVEAIGSLCLKFPTKLTNLVGFLGGRLRDEGSANFKKKIVTVLANVVKESKECKELVLDILTEFIEDCEFADVAIEALYLIPSILIEISTMTEQLDVIKYVRFIYNRLLLEVAPVRMAALGALIKLADAFRADTRAWNTLVQLIRQCTKDDDDDIRDRALVFLCSTGEKKGQPTETDCLIYDLDVLEEKVKTYLETLNFHSSIIVDDVPMMSVSGALSKTTEKGKRSGSLTASPSVEKKKRSLNTIHPPSPGASFKQELPYHVTYLQESNVGLLSGLGPMLQRLPKIVSLTERDTEYMVQVTKYIYTAAVVLEYKVKNTMTDLELVHVGVKTGEFPEGLELLSTMEIETLGPESTGICLYIYQIPPLQSMIDLESFPCVGVIGDVMLTFNAREIGMDEITNDGTFDEYSLQEYGLLIGDFLIPSESSSMDNFEGIWKELDHNNKQVYQLSAIKNLSSAIFSIKETFDGLTVVAASDKLHHPNAPTHTLYLQGAFMGKENRVAIKIRMAVVGNTGVTIELTVKATQPFIALWLSNGL